MSHRLKYGTFIYRLTANLWKLHINFKRRPRLIKLRYLHGLYTRPIEVRIVAQAVTLLFTTVSKGYRGGPFTGDKAAGS
jgi:hypothetical protein